MSTAMLRDGRPWPIWVLSSDDYLAAVLAARLARTTEGSIALSRGETDGMCAGDIVVAPVADCDLRRARSLVARGLHVFVLAPSPTTDDRLHYLDAGIAEFLPMDADGRNLDRAVLKVVDGLAQAP